MLGCSAADRIRKELEIRIVNTLCGNICNLKLAIKFCTVEKHMRLVLIYIYIYICVYIYLYVYIYMKPTHLKQKQM